MKLSELFIEASETNDIVVGYVGKFEPFHKGHLDLYERLVQQFGKDKVYLFTTSQRYLNKQDKLQIIRSYGIKANKIIPQSSYNIEGLLGAVNKPNATLIVAYSDKDGRQLGVKYKPYNPKTRLKKGEAFFIEAETNKKISSSQIRKLVANKQWDKLKKLVNDFTFEKLKQGIINDNIE